MALLLPAFSAASAETQTGRTSAFRSNAERLSALDRLKSDARDFIRRYTGAERDLILEKNVFDPAKELLGPAAKESFDAAKSVIDAGKPEEEGPANLLDQEVERKKDVVRINDSADAPPAEANIKLGDLISQRNCEYNPASCAPRPPPSAPSLPATGVPLPSYGLPPLDGGPR